MAFTHFGYAVTFSFLGLTFYGHLLNIMLLQRSVNIITKRRAFEWKSSQGDFKALKKPMTEAPFKTS